MKIKCILKMCSFYYDFLHFVFQKYEGTSKGLWKNGNEI